MKKLSLQLLVSLPLLFGTAKLGAQVSIGADKAPKPFSVLELVSQYKTDTYGGLRLSQSCCHCIKKYCTFAIEVNNIKCFCKQLKTNKICIKHNIILSW